MEQFNFRTAIVEDISFLVDTIIEAEKGGSGVLSYTTLFGLSLQETRKYLTLMLAEEIDGCELSVSSFCVAEAGGQVVAALSSWLEGSEEISSKELKGNLLSYCLPADSIKRAISANSIVKQLQFENKTGTIQKGAGYVIKEYRNRNLFGILTERMIAKYQFLEPGVKEVYTRVFGSNVAGIVDREHLFSLSAT